MNSRNIIHAIARIVVLVPVLGAIIATGTGSGTGSLVGLDGAQHNVSCGGAFLNSFEHGPQGGWRGRA